MLTGINHEPLYRLIYGRLTHIAQEQVGKENILFDIEHYLLDNLYSPVETRITDELIRSIN